MSVLDLALTIGIGAVTLTLLMCGWRLLLGPTIADRVGENELALAELDKATAAIGELRTGGSATMDMESAMAELARIAQRSSQYE